MKRQGLIPAAMAVVVIAVAAGVWFLPGSGRQAPELTLTTLQGEPLPLADLKGNPVMLQFWATTCRTCVAEMPHLKALHERFKGDGFRLVAVAMPYDPPDQVREMVAQKGLPYTVVLDKEGTVTSAFGNVQLTPTTVLIDINGQIAWKRRGKLDFERLRHELSRRLDQRDAG